MVRIDVGFHAYTKRLVRSLRLVRRTARRENWTRPMRYMRLYAMLERIAFLSGAGSYRAGEWRVFGAAIPYVPAGILPNYVSAFDRRGGIRDLL